MDSKILNLDFTRSVKPEVTDTASDTEPSRESTQPKGIDNLHEYILEIAGSVKSGGYDPVSQLMGFLLSDEPTHIANYDGARAKIGKVDRYDLLEDMVKYYLGTELCALEDTDEDDNR